jgi:hypothetical protein
MWDAYFAALDVVRPPDTLVTALYITWNRDDQTAAIQALRRVSVR